MALEVVDLSPTALLLYSRKYVPTQFKLDKETRPHSCIPMFCSPNHGNRVNSLLGDVAVTLITINCGYYRNHKEKNYNLALMLDWSNNDPSLPLWYAVWSYRPHLEIRGPIWGDDWLHSLHRRLLAEVFQGFPQL